MCDFYIKHCETCIQKTLFFQMALKAEHGQPGNSLFDFLSRWVNHHGDGKRDVLVLSVVLLGGPQSGRSSVGNALLGQSFYRTFV